MNRLDTSQDIQIAPILQEEFRSLYTNIEFSGADNRVICVTSTYPSEGKSYVSYQLAKIMADGSHNVLLIDTDMRNSTMHKMLGFDKNMMGLSHVLCNMNLLLEDAIYQTSHPGFYFMPTGVNSNNPAGLFRQDYFGKVIGSLKQSFRYIIIDTAPIGLVTDASIVANLCDSSLLVVGVGMEKRTEALKSIHALKEANENFLGVVMNKVNKKKNRSKYYGNYYGNYYGKGY